MNLHERIIQEIVMNPFLLEVSIEMYECRITPNISLGEHGDIDLLVSGFEYLTQQPKTAVIEVKAHQGLVAHYKRFQLPKYVEKFPDARQIVVFSRSGNPYFSDLVFLRV